MSRFYAFANPLERETADRPDPSFFVHSRDIRPKASRMGMEFRGKHLHRHAPVDGNDAPGHEGRLVATGEQNGMSDFFHCSEAAHGLPGDKHRLHRLRIGRCSDLFLNRWSVGRSGTDAIYPYIVLDVVGGHGFCQGHHRPFGRAVGAPSARFPSAGFLLRGSLPAF